jgi:hypothetical protein
MARDQRHPVRSHHRRQRGPRRSSGYGVHAGGPSMRIRLGDRRYARCR